MTDTAKTCSRPGCGKKLYRSNTSGDCSSGCLSPEAPPSLRARATSSSRPAAAKARPVAAKKSDDGTALERFRVVCSALGRDPDAELEEFAEGWLDALREKLGEAA